MPDSAFAYVQPGGRRDKEGKTVPRALRHLPLIDAAHVRDAAARFNQVRFHSAPARVAAWHKLESAARRHGVKLGVKLDEKSGRLVEKESRDPDSETGEATLRLPKGLGVLRFAQDAPLGQFRASHLTQCPRKSETREGFQCPSLSTHASELPEGEAPEWIELIPCGTFEGRDGRGPFVLDNPESVIRATAALDMDAGLPIDYEHATDFAAPEGRPAPAAGWIKELQVRAGDRGRAAIFARVEWTERAAKMIAAKEYRYISPVFEFERPPDAPADKQTGSVTRILRAALTNNPNLVMAAVAAAEKTLMSKKESRLREIAAAIREMAKEIGVPAHVLHEHLGALIGHADGKPGENDGGDGEEDMHGADFEHPEGDADARDGEGDFARHARALAQCVQRLEAERAREQALARVESAVKEGKLAPSLRDWALSHCISDPEGFERFIARSPVIVGRRLDSAFMTRPPDSCGEAALTDDEARICAALKLEPKKFAGRRAAMTAAAERASFVTRNL